MITQSKSRIVNLLFLKYSSFQSAPEKWIELLIKPQGSSEIGTFNPHVLLPLVSLWHAETLTTVEKSITVTSRIV